MEAMEDRNHRGRKGSYEKQQSKKVDGREIFKKTTIIEETESGEPFISETYDYQTSSMGYIPDNKEIKFVAVCRFNHGEHEDGVLVSKRLDGIEDETGKSGKKFLTQNEVMKCFRCNEVVCPRHAIPTGWIPEFKVYLCPKCRYNKRLLRRINLHLILVVLINGTRALIDPLFGGKIEEMHILTYEPNMASIVKKPFRSWKFGKIFKRHKKRKNTDSEDGSYSQRAIPRRKRIEPDKNSGDTEYR